MFFQKNMLYSYYDRGVNIVMKSKNKFLYFLSLPFIGIYYTVDFIFDIINYFFTGLFFVFKPLIIFFKYVSLGCYYTVYGIFYPLIFIFNKIIDIVYNQNNKKINLKEVAPFEEIKTEEKKVEEVPQEIKKKENLKEYFARKYNELSVVKAQKRKQDEQIRALVLEVQRDKSRSEKPVAFKYVALDPKGKKVSNIFIAMSKMEVLTYLTNENYKVLSLTTSKLINILYGPDNSFQTKMSTKDLIFWLTQLSTYLKSGITLTESMRILSKQLGKNKSRKRLYNSIVYNLTMGESFSTALYKQGKTFPALLISMIKTAEATGELEATLDDMADYYTEIENTRKAMISALMYPSIISVFSVGVITFILLYVMPKFKDIYASAGAELNFFTQFLLDASEFLKVNIYNIILVILVIALIISLLYKNVKVFRKAIQEFAMKLPLFGKIIIYKEMNIFAKTFASLLKNNVFITESISLLSEVTNNEIYKEIMLKTINNIAKGEKISESFYNQWAVPEVAYYMIVTGESTGELADMMDKVAKYYQTEHRSLVDNLQAFIEPIMIIALAVIVGGIVLAIVLPMFGLYQNIH